jgi:pimeloyl-ACP methyl ester carboxylesterase
MALMASSTAQFEARGGEGVSLACYRYGSGSTVVVGVHGLGGEGDVFADLFTHHLPLDVGGVSFDLRGHGASEKPPSIASYGDGVQWAGDLHGVLQRINADRIVLLGWSLGAMVIGDYLCRYGEDRIDGVVLVGPAYSIGDTRAKSMAGREFLLALSRYLTDEQDLDALSLFAEVVTDPYDDRRVRAQLESAAGRVPLVARKGIFSRARSVLDAYAQSTVPCLVIHGMNDAVVDPRSSLEAESHTNTVVKLIEEMGHAPFLSHPDRFGVWLDRFLHVVVTEGFWGN